MEAEGVTFHCNVHVGRDISARKLERDYDAVLLAGGAEHPRDLAIEGRALARRALRDEFSAAAEPPRLRRAAWATSSRSSPTGKQVVVIGGGDTGSDCIGTSFRQGAVSVTQLEILPMPPEQENKALTWPNWPLKLRTSSSQAEGAARDFSRGHQPLHRRGRRGSRRSNASASTAS